MQVKNIKIQSSQRKKRLLLILKSVVSATCLFFILNHLWKQDILFTELQLPPFFHLILFVQIFLMITNWYLEAYRWKLSVEPFERISLSQATSDVLGGLAMNWVGPFTTGDLITRMMARKDKFRTASAILLNRGVMLLLTASIGLYGVAVYSGLMIRHEYVLITISILTLLIVLFKRIFLRFFPYFFEIGRVLLTKVVFISILRYLVFLTQFVILLHLFLPDLKISILIAGIGWVFLIRTYVPSLLGGLGLREASAFLFFEAYISNMELVIFPVFLMWIINTAIPSIFGVILIWKLRFKIA